MRRTSLKCDEDMACGRLKVQGGSGRCGERPSDTAKMMNLGFAPYDAPTRAEWRAFNAIGLRDFCSYPETRPIIAFLSYDEIHAGLTNAAPSGPRIDKKPFPRVM